MVALLLFKLFITIQLKHVVRTIAGLNSSEMTVNTWCLNWFQLFLASLSPLNNFVIIISTIPLKTSEPPDPPANKPFVAKCANDILKIVWPGTTYDGGCIVTGYLVEMYDDATKKWKVLTKNVFSTGYDVTGLKKDGKYKFRVSCINEVGTSKPSAESDFISPKDHEGEGEL